MFSKFFNKYLSKKKHKALMKDLRSVENNQNAKEFLDWLVHDHGKVYFRLKSDEMKYLITNYLLDWEKNEFDDSFLTWDSKTQHLELNYFIEAIKGDHGFKIAQNAFDYLHDTYPPLAEYFKVQEQI